MEEVEDIDLFELEDDSTQCEESSQESDVWNYS